MVTRKRPWLLLMKLSLTCLKFSDIIDPIIIPQYHHHGSPFDMDDYAIPHRVQNVSKKTVFFTWIHALTTTLVRNRQTDRYIICLIINNAA